MRHYSATPPLSFSLVRDTATPNIYTLSLHDALPICSSGVRATSSSTSDTRSPTEYGMPHAEYDVYAPYFVGDLVDRKSTRLNSSHGSSSYAVFCLKKKAAHEPH